MLLRVQSRPGSRLDAKKLWQRRAAVSLFGIVRELKRPRAHHLLKYRGFKRSLPAIKACNTARAPRRFRSGRKAKPDLSRHNRILPPKFYAGRDNHTATRD